MKSLYGAFSLLILFTTPAAFAHKSCEQYYAELEAKLGKSYEATRDPVLPAQVSFGIEKHDPDQLFHIFEGLWNDTVNKKQLLQMIQKLALDGQVDAQTMQDMKLIRAKLKQLRFAYMSFDRGHDYPKELDKLTAALGHLQDAFKFSNPEQIRNYAKNVEPYLTHEKLHELDHELKAFHADTLHDFKKWQAKELKDLRELITRDELPAPIFHEARKIVSRQTEIFFVLNTAHPSPERQAATDFLSKIAGEMGDIHDKLVAKSMNAKDPKQAKSDYEKEMQTVPPNIRKEVLEYIYKFQNDTP